MQKVKSLATTDYSKSAPVILMYLNIDSGMAFLAKEIGGLKYAINWQV